MKMRHRLPRAQHRAPSRVKRHQASRGFAGELLRHFVDEFDAERIRAKQRTFDAKIGKLVEGIDLAQFGVKLQTVEYGDGVAKADMLRAQVAMPVDDLALKDVLLQQ